MDCTVWTWLKRFEALDWGDSIINYYWGNEGLDYNLKINDDNFINLFGLKTRKTHSFTFHFLYNITKLIIFQSFCAGLLKRGCVSKGLQSIYKTLCICFDVIRVLNKADSQQHRVNKLKRIKSKIVRTQNKKVLFWSLGIFQKLLNFHFP